jgi:hypothetical protein
MEDRLNPSPRSASLGELGKEAIRKLAHELQEYLAASEQGYNLIGIALERAPCTRQGTWERHLLLTNICAR